MAGVLYQLGSFQFNLQEGSPREVERQLSWRWPQQDRIGRKPAVQYLGPDGDQITLDGVLYPGQFGKQGTIDDLRKIADEGKPVTFTDGLGRVYPRMVITSIRESRSALMDNGAARRIAFTVTISEYGEDLDGTLGGFLSVPAGLAGYVGQLAKAAASVAPFQAAGSAFDLVSSVTGPALAGFSSAAGAAGFSPGQLGALGQAAGGAANLPGAMAPLGITGALSGLQSAAWGAVGISAQGLIGAALGGQSPSASALAFDALRGAGQAVIDDLGGQAAGALGSLVKQASTISPLLNVDPAVTQRLLPDLVIE
jgi:uncharacterized protein